MSQDITKIVFRVSLISGEKRDHIYDAPSKEEETDEFFDKRLTRIINSLMREKQATLYFNNPVTIYNPDNVMSVEIIGITAGDIEMYIESAQRKMGFVK